MSNSGSDMWHTLKLRILKPNLKPNFIANYYEIIIIINY